MNIKKFSPSQLLVFILLGLGVFLRLYQLGTVPGGLNQDEAFAGYEAYSLLNSGIDSSGYHNPVYFVSWGSGMNVLESYLMMPFVKLFGLTVLSIRLPQAILSCVCLPVFYLFMKKLFCEKAAIFGLLLLTIMPWHLMMSRWALESNLAPAFLLFGLYFFVKGLEKPGHLLFSAIFYGMCLYSYAPMWVLVPLLVTAQVVYAAAHKKIRLNRYTIASGVILFTLALPLLLFCAVNLNIIPEIRSAIISIPKLAAMRSNEISPGNLLQGDSYQRLFQLVTVQNDHMLWNSTEKYGLYYLFSTPIMLLGAVHILRNLRARLRAHEFSLSAFLVFQLFFACLLGLLISGANTNKVNCIHIPLIACCSIGVYEIFKKLGKTFGCALLAAYMLSFLSFQYYYFGAYNEQISKTFQQDAGTAIHAALELTDEEICIDKSIYYPKVLFYSKLPATVFKETVRYTNYPSAFLDVAAFDRFVMGINTEALQENTVYVIPSTQFDLFQASGYFLDKHGDFAVAYNHTMKYR